MRGKPSLQIYEAQKWQAGPGSLAPLVPLEGSFKGDVWLYKGYSRPSNLQNWLGSRAALGWGVIGAKQEMLTGLTKRLSDHPQNITRPSVDYINTRILQTSWYLDTRWFPNGHQIKGSQGSPNGPTTGGSKSTPWWMNLKGNVCDEPPQRGLGTLTRPRRLRKSLMGP